MIDLYVIIFLFGAFVGLFVGIVSKSKMVSGQRTKRVTMPQNKAEILQEKSSALAKMEANNARLQDEIVILKGELLCYRSEAEINSMVEDKLKRAGHFNS